MLRSKAASKRTHVSGLLACSFAFLALSPSVRAADVPVQAAASKSCFNDLSFFLKDINERKAEMATRFSRDIKNDSTIRNIGRSIRDSVRHRLQLWNGHPYPVLAIDDAPFALGWAKNAVGKLDAASGALVNVEQIWKELNEQIGTIRSFQKDISDLTDQSVNNSILIQALKNKLSDKALPPFGVQLEVPVFGRDAAGAETQTVRTVYYGTTTQMSLELKALEATERALGKTSNDRALSQAIDIKRLETYRHELIRQKMANSGVAIPQEYEDFLKSVNDIYTDDTGKTVKAEFNPPAWAWQKLKWQQLSAESKSLYLKEIPKLKEQKRIKEALDYVKTLTPDEIRALGLQNVATSVDKYKRYRWVRLGGALAGLIGVPGGAHFGLKEIIYFFHEDSIKKEKCVGLEAEDAYLDCASEYLKDKFPGRFFVNVTDLAKLLDENGDIKDADIKAEIDDIRDRRVQYLYGKNIQSGITGPAKTRLAAEDPSSSEFRQHLINIRSDHDFKAALTNPDHQKGYLMFKYSLAFSKPNIQELVTTILNADAADQQHVILNSMRNRYPISSEMAKDLEEILNDRRQIQFDTSEEDRVAKELNVNLDKLLNRNPTEQTASKPQDSATTDSAANAPVEDAGGGIIGLQGDPADSNAQPALQPDVQPSTQPSTQPATKGTDKGSSKGTSNSGEIVDPVEKE